MSNNLSKAHKNWHGHVDDVAMIPATRHLNACDHRLSYVKSTLHVFCRLSSGAILGHAQRCDANGKNVSECCFSCSNSLFWLQMECHVDDGSVFTIAWRLYKVLLLSKNKVLLSRV